MRQQFQDSPKDYFQSEEELMAALQEMTTIGAFPTKIESFVKEYGIELLL
jgi:hypothetical protein